MTNRAEVERMEYVRGKPFCPQCTEIAKQHFELVDELSTLRTQLANAQRAIQAQLSGGGLRSGDAGCTCDKCDFARDIRSALAYTGTETDAHKGGTT